MRVAVQPGSRVPVRDVNIAESAVAVLWSLPSTLSLDHSVNVKRRFSFCRLHLLCRYVLINFYIKLFQVKSFVNLCCEVLVIRYNAKRDLFNYDLCQYQVISYFTYITEGHKQYFGKLR